MTTYDVDLSNLGAHSIDGSGLSRYSWMREKIYMAHRNPKLLDLAQPSAGQ